jgi:predicted PurR-regulated permease PerM
MGKDTVVVAAQTLIAMVVGALISIYERDVHREPGPLGAALVERARRLAGAFHSIVFSQVRISAINTVFSGIYLVIVLPLFDVHLPLTKTLIGITFFAGLLPVIGNLISNCAIVLVSLAHSPQIAVTSLVFLVVIHKLEYFLNARIIGSQIEARAWELLLAMVAMDAIFGVYGLVAAPIYYAFLKSELASAGLV